MGLIVASFSRYPPAAATGATRQARSFDLLGSAISASRLKFRAGGSTLVPYYECELSGEDWKKAKVEADLVEIVVGPCPNMDQAVSAVQQLLHKENLTGCTVSGSTIPYRTW